MSSILKMKRNRYRLSIARNLQIRINQKRLLTSQKTINNKISLTTDKIEKKEKTKIKPIFNCRNIRNIYLTIKSKIPIKPKFRILKNPYSLDSKVKIYLYTVCYNEEFIIPHFLKHYDYVDKIFIYDNCSNDNSVKLLKMDPRCEIIKFSSNFDDTINQYIKNNCWKQHRNLCDYAIVCDIDEFLWINNNTSIKNLLQLYKNKNKYVDYLPTLGYNMVSKNVIDSNIRLIDQVKNGVKDNMYSKYNIFNVNTVQDMCYGPGSHICNIKTYSNNIHIGPKILLLHYKFIGGKKRLRKRYSQFGKRLSQVNKNRKEGLHYLKNPDIEYDKLCLTSSKILV